jgi:hypothetical protein
MLERGFSKKPGKKETTLTLRLEDTMSPAIMPKGELQAANISSEMLQSYSPLSSMRHGDLLDHPPLLPSIPMKTLLVDSFASTSNLTRSTKRVERLKEALISTYFPCEGQRHDKFYTVLDSMLNSINTNTVIIIGGNINARIGTCTCEEHMQILWPYGIPTSNAQGENLLHALAGHKLQIENPFFNHREEDYFTYTSIPTVHHPHGVPRMFQKHIHDYKMVLHSVASDHRAICLKVALISVKCKAHRAMSRGTINWPTILTDEHTQMVYNEHRPLPHHSGN